MIWRGCGGMYTLSPDKGSLRLLLMYSSNSMCSHLPTDILTWEMMYVQVYLLLCSLQQKSLKQGKYPSTEERWNKLSPFSNHSLCSHKKEWRCSLLIQNDLQDVLYETKQVQNNNNKKRKQKKRKRGDTVLASLF